MRLDVPSPSISPHIPLGEVIAERRFTLREATGKSRLIWVRMGKPIATDQVSVPQEGGGRQTFRCPLQIIGLDCDDKVFAPVGEDPFVALQYAIHLAGDVLDRATKRLNLDNPLEIVRERALPGGPHYEDAGRASWIWKFDSRADLACGL